MADPSAFPLSSSLVSMGTKAQIEARLAVGLLGYARSRRRHANLRHRQPRALAGRARHPRRLRPRRPPHLPAAALPGAAGPGHVARLEHARGGGRGGGGRGGGGRGGGGRRSGGRRAARRAAAQAACRARLGRRRAAGLARSLLVCAGFGAASASGTAERSPSPKSNLRLSPSSTRRCCTTASFRSSAAPQSGCGSAGGSATASPREFRPALPRLRVWARERASTPAPGQPRPAAVRRPPGAQTRAEQSTASIARRSRRLGLRSRALSDDALGARLRPRPPCCECWAANSAAWGIVLRPPPTRLRRLLHILFLSTARAAARRHRGDVAGRAGDLAPLGTYERTPPPSPPPPPDGRANAVDVSAMQPNPGLGRGGCSVRHGRPGPTTRSGSSGRPSASTTTSCSYAARRVPHLAPCTCCATCFPFPAPVVARVRHADRGVLRGVSPVPAAVARGHAPVGRRGCPRFG